MRPTLGVISHDELAMIGLVKRLERGCIVT